MNLEASDIACAEQLINMSQSEGGRDRRGQLAPIDKNKGKQRASQQQIGLLTHHVCYAKQLTLNFDLKIFSVVPHPHVQWRVFFHNSCPWPRRHRR